MEKLENLKLGEKKIDTALASEFISKSKLQWPVAGNIFEKNYNDKDSSQTILEKWALGKRLAKKIEDNVEMFVQLEHLARGTEAQDVTNGHIKLMSQILQCADALWSQRVKSGFLVFSENTPLYMLAAVARYIFVDDKTPLRIAVTSQKMIYLSQFFFDLCYGVGIQFVAIYGDLPDIRQSLRSAEELKMAENPAGCTAVVAEWSDMESALDAFIDSSVTAPWRLTQIYVQESVFENFKKALALRSVGDHNLHIIGNKQFDIEVLETSTNSDQRIPVHAYRTTKELLSMLDTRFISVWAANSAESNEIALNCKSADLVWINEYGTFDGPPRSAIPFYNLHFKKYGHTPSISFLRRCKSWASLKPAERIEILTNQFTGYNFDDKLHGLMTRRSDDFIHVTDKTICFGVQQPLGIFEFEEFDGNFTDICKVLISGNFVVLTSKISEETMSRLVGAEIPVELHRSGDGEYILHPTIMEKLRVVRSNFGTIFAN